MADDFDPVNKPKHYASHPSGVECIQITEHMTFTLGNALKYIWRADLKGGVEDLKKAVWYLQREIARRENALKPKIATLADWAKKLDPEGKGRGIVELLAQTNNITDDMLWLGGDLPPEKRQTLPVQIVNKVNKKTEKLLPKRKYTKRKKRVGRPPGRKNK